MISLLLFLLFLILPSQATGVEMTTKFGLNHDWRFTLEDAQPNPECSPDIFPFDMSSKQCFGLSPVLYANSQDTCLLACCADDTCEVWQWCDGSSACGSSESCWIGTLGECTDQEEGWVGAYRNELPPPPEPSSTCNTTLTPECGGADFDDSSWRTLDIPHDFVVEGTVDEMKGDISHGFLPVGVGW